MKRKGPGRWLVALLLIPAGCAEPDEVRKPLPQPVRSATATSGIPLGGYLTRGDPADALTLERTAPPLDDPFFKAGPLVPDAPAPFEPDPPEAGRR